MFKSYLLITVRNLLKNKLFSLINILGLALGIASSTILFLLIKHETSYDSFHKQKNLIFRVTETIDQNGVGEHSASVPFPVAITLQKDYSQWVEKSVRLFNFQMPSLSISYKNKNYNESKFFFADSSFFEVFDFKLIEGDAQICLSQAHTVVISESIAKKYFGNENPLGKEIILKRQIDIPLIVTGVFADSQKPSHLVFDFIASFSTLYNISNNDFFNQWVWNPCWTYVVLKDIDFAEQLKGQLPTFVQKYFDEKIKDDVSLDLQPLTDIHLRSNLDYEISPNGDIKYVYIFILTAAFILLIASINFINLSNARALLRAKEVVVRKAIGADKEELTKQFIIESVLMSSIALIFAFIDVELAAPYLQDLSGSPISAYITNDWNIIKYVLLTGLSIGLVAGIYPAIYLASFDPSKMHRGSVLTGTKEPIFRSVLVVIQFVIAILLLISTFVSSRQLDYLKNAKLGFDKDYVLVVPIGGSPSVLLYDEIKKRLLHHGEIISVTSMEEILGSNYQTHKFKANSLVNNKLSYYPSIIVSHDFLSTFNIELVTGRNFIQKRKLAEVNDAGINMNEDWFRYFEEDENNAVIINETMVNYLGMSSPQEAIGKEFSRAGGTEKIIGVVKDFHITSLHSPVLPFVIDLADDKIQRSFLKYMAIKVDNKDIEKAILVLEKVWKKLNPYQALDYFFLEDKLNKLYMKEQQWSKISLQFSLVAISIACMGLFGLASFIVEKQRKDVGIRRAIGATMTEIVLFLSAKLMKLVVASILVAAPISWILMQIWLSSFPYHIVMSPDIFIYAAGIIFIITFITISFHTIKIAIQTPMEAIKSL
ncbi:MAG: FtsX-like permease family protein [Cytophagales bacterium]|nr:MAG: FtsX-like permease family protein [Cytophagales bacterium]